MAPDATSDTAPRVVRLATPEAGHTRPGRGTISAELVGEQVDRQPARCVIGDSIMASTATRYSGYMCDELVPLGLGRSRSRPNRAGSSISAIVVLDKRLDPIAATTTTGTRRSSTSGATTARDQERFEAELRLILTRLAPRPTLLFTVTQYKPDYAEANETHPQARRGVRQRHPRSTGSRCRSFPAC